MIYGKPFLKDASDITNAGVLANLKRVCAITCFEGVDKQGQQVLQKSEKRSLNTHEEAYRIFGREKYQIRCTGFAINSHQVITTAHGVNPSFDGYVIFDFYVGNSTITPRIFNFSSASITKYVQNDLCEFDFAVIHFDEPIIQETAFPDNACFPDAIAAYAIGFPLGMKATISYAKDNVLMETYPFMFAFLDMFSGSSGSPVFDKHHRFLGLFRTTVAADFVEVGDELRFVVLPKEIPQKPKTIIMERIITNTLKSNL
ncbi:MAG: serine protease [Chitinophagales bacterium]|nr:serine protease [Chitinophagales bacterium]